MTSPSLYISDHYGLSDCLSLLAAAEQQSDYGAEEESPPPVASESFQTILKRLNETGKRPINFSVIEMPQWKNSYSEFESLMMTWYITDAGSRFREFVKDLWDAMDQQYVLLAKNKTQTVGFAIFNLEVLYGRSDDPDCLALHSYLQWIGVKSEWRNRGIGQRLFSAYLKYLHERVTEFANLNGFYSYLTPMGENNATFYKKLGYRYAEYGDTALAKIHGPGKRIYNLMATPLITVERGATNKRKRSTGPKGSSKKSRR